MNRLKLWLVVAGFIFVFTTMVFFENPAPVGAAETCFPVKIWDRDKIEPLSLSINKGDCVVWVNFSLPGSSAEHVGTTEGDVLISFPNAKTCVLDEINASVGFKMEEATNCFVGGWIRPGETASIVFAEPGTYKYDIQFRFGKEVRDATSSGTIIVK